MAKEALSGRLAAIVPPVSAMVGATKDYVDTYDHPGTVGYRDMNVLGWSHDPNQSLMTVPALTSGQIQMSRIYVPVSGIATEICIGIHTTAGAGLNGYAGAALYSDAGTRLGLSATNEYAAFQTIGLGTLPLTAGVAVTSGTYYWCAVLVTTGTTMPSVLCSGTSTSMLAALNTRNKRGIKIAGSTLPTSLTPSGGTNSFLLWTALL